MAGARRPGRNFLFVPGPTNVPDRILRAMHIAMEDHRSSDFPKLTLPLYEDLKKIFKTRDGQVVIYPSSGTGAWESALTNTMLARRQAARRAIRPVQPSLDRARPPPRARGHRPGGGVGHRRPTPSASRRRSARTRTTRSRASWSSITRRRPASPATSPPCAAPSTPPATRRCFTSTA